MINTNTTIERIVTNARNLGKNSQTAAMAATLMGAPAAPLCCWCAEHEDGQKWRLPQGGECVRCPYVGVDCLVVEAIHQTPAPRLQDGLKITVDRVQRTV